MTAPYQYPDGFLCPAVMPRAVRAECLACGRLLPRPADAADQEATP